MFTVENLPVVTEIEDDKVSINATDRPSVKIIEVWAKHMH